MTTPRPRSVGDRTRLRAPYGRLILAALALLSLPGCSCLARGWFDTSGTRYRCGATIRSADGVESVLGSDNLVEFAGEQPVFAETEQERMGLAPRERVRRAWLGYLREVLAARSGDAGFTALYGSGPWCVLGEPLVEDTGDGIDILDEGVVLLTTGSTPPLSQCSTTCAARACFLNPPGVTPVLGMTVDGVPAEEVAFGDQPVGAPVSKTVVLSNAGTGRLCLNTPTLDLASSDPDFELTFDPLRCRADLVEGAVVLGSGSTCEFRVAFTPTAAGERTALIRAGSRCSWIDVRGTGLPGRLTASPAPACFAPPLAPGECRLLQIRIENGSGATVDLTSAVVDFSAPGGWERLRLVASDGVTEIDLTAAPYPLRPGEHVLQEVRACELVLAASALRVTHNGTDYGAPGSPTGDVDAGSPLVVRLLQPSSGCTP